MVGCGGDREVFDRPDGQLQVPGVIIPLGLRGVFGYVHVIRWSGVPVGRGGVPEQEITEMIPSVTVKDPGELTGYKQTHGRGEDDIQQPDPSSISCASADRHAIQVAKETQILPGLSH